MTESFINLELKNPDDGRAGKEGKEEKEEKKVRSR